METPTHLLEETDKAWLAAMVDGEGTIGVYRSRRPKNKSGWRFVPYISVTNTDKRLMDRFAELCGPWITRVRSYVRDPRQNKKPRHIVEIRYGKCNEFLNAILPYLIAKKEQAKIVLEFLQLQVKPGQRTFNLTQKFNELYIQSRILNRSGLKPVDVEKLRLDIAA